MHRMQEHSPLFYGSYSCLNKTRGAHSLLLLLACHTTSPSASRRAIPLRLRLRGVAFGYGRAQRGALVNKVNESGVWCVLALRLLFVWVWEESGVSGRNQWKGALRGSESVIAVI